MTEDPAGTLADDRQMLADRLDAATDVQAYQRLYFAAVDRHTTAQVAERVAYSGAWARCYDARTITERAAVATGEVAPLLAAAARQVRGDAVKTIGLWLWAKTLTQRARDERDLALERFIGARGRARDAGVDPGPFPDRGDSEATF